MKNLFVRFIREYEGQDLIEYAFLAVFIALVVIAGLGSLADGLNSQFSSLGSTVGTAGS